MTSYGHCIYMYKIGYIPSILFTLKQGESCVYIHIYIYILYGSFLEARNRTSPKGRALRGSKLRPDTVHTDTHRSPALSFSLVREVGWSMVEGGGRVAVVFVKCELKCSKYCRSIYDVAPFLMFFRPVKPLKLAVIDGLA